MRRSDGIGHMPYPAPQKRPDLHSAGRSAANRGILAAVALEGGVVGRSSDLALVATVLDRALAERPGAVLLRGEAGVGKTTMLRAAVGLAGERGFAAATGSCAEGASGTSFAPFRTALRGLGAAYGPPVVSGAVAASPAAAMLLPAGMRPSGVPGVSPDAGELYDAVLEFVGALAAERPVLLALEDLHWADRSTLELLSFLARNLTAERAVLVGTARTEDVAPDEPAGRTLTELARLGSTTRLDLVGLDTAAFQQLVAAAGASLDDAEVEALHRRTGGNPFFALELVEAGSASGSGPMPPSVTDAIDIRLGSLCPDDITAVRTAAVAGAVDASVLALVLGRREEDIEGSLRAAVSAGVLVADPESGDVSFRHAIVREVAYGGLLTSERRRLHEAVATALGQLDDSDPALLAHHYTAANRPADALRTSITAARAAAGAYGSVDAVDHYMRAVQSWNVVPPSERPSEPAFDELLQEAMVCALNVGTVHEGAELGSRLLEGLDPAKDPERWALYATRQAELRWELGDAAGATALLDRAERHLAGRADSVARVRMLERRAFQSIVRGDRAEGRDLAREALEIARRVGDPEAIVVALNRVALAATALGETDGEALLHEAFEEAWLARLPHEMTRAAINMILLLHTGCRLADTITAGERVLEAAGDLAIGPSHRAALEALYARALVDAGEWDRADDLLTSVRLPNAQRLRTYVAIAIAELATARGDAELARSMIAEGRFDLIFVLALRRACVEAELALAGGEPHVTRAVVDEYLPLAEFILDASYARLSALALRSLAKGDREVADTYLAGAERRAAAVREVPAGAPADQAAWLAAARAAHASVTGEPASARWADATELFAAAGLVVRRAWTQLEQAISIVEEGGDRSAAAALAAEAHALARRLGAEPLRRGVETLVRRARLEVPGIARLAHGDLGLTPREAEVLRLVAAGRTNREIADELYVSVKTASVHVSNILRKVGATTRGEAAAIAHRDGLIATT
jgi:DNA-binding NarL/FixJ family response regulator